jgi:hypothetical protein
MLTLPNLWYTVPESRGIDDMDGWMFGRVGAEVDKQVDRQNKPR